MSIAAVTTLDASRSLIERLLTENAALAKERDAAVRERDETAELAHAGLTEAARLAAVIKDIPTGRRTVLKEVASGLQSAKDVYDPEFIRILEAHPPKKE